MVSAGPVSDSIGLLTVSPTSPRASAVGTLNQLPYDVVTLLRCDIAIGIKQDHVLLYSHISYPLASWNATSLPRIKRHRNRDVKMVTELLLIRDRQARRALRTRPQRSHGVAGAGPGPATAADRPAGDHAHPRRLRFPLGGAPTPTNTRSSESAHRAAAGTTVVAKLELAVPLNEAVHEAAFDNSGGGRTLVAINTNLIGGICVG